LQSPIECGAVYFGSSLGRVEGAARAVAEELGITKVVDLYKSPITGAVGHRFVVLAMSTWYDGILQDDWREHESELSALDWSSTTVAMLCMGDQYGYPQTFADALGIVWDAIQPRGATLVGRWDPRSDPAGYDFRASRGMREVKFLGLALDDDNQNAATDQRIKMWCEQIRYELSELG